MKFYRVASHNDDAEHTGYSFHTSKADAKKQFLLDRKSLDQKEESDAEAFENALYVCDIKPTKKGILAALNKLASHPDNG